MDVTATLTLLGIVRTVKPFETFFLSMFFPLEVTFATEEIAFDKLVEGLKMAPLVSHRVSGKVLHEKGGKLTRWAPPYVKPLHIVEPGRLLKRNAGEKISGELDPIQRRQAVIVDLLALQDKMITIREEWLALNFILFGKVTIDMEGGDAYLIDYGRSAANNITLSGAALWTALDKATSEQPISDIEDWAENCSQGSDIVIMDKLAFREFRQFKCVKDALDVRRGGDSTLNLGPDTAKVVSYYGHIGTVAIYVHKGMIENDAGDEVRMLPDYCVIIGSSTYQGIRAYGAIQDARANAAGIVETTRYPSNWFTDNPSVENIMTQSAPLPVTPDPDAFCVVIVG